MKSLVRKPKIGVILEGQTFEKRAPKGFTALVVVRHVKGGDLSVIPAAAPFMGWHECKWAIERGAVTAFWLPATERPYLEIDEAALKEAWLKEKNERLRGDFAPKPEGKPS